MIKRILKKLNTKKNKSSMSIHHNGTLFFDGRVKILSPFYCGG